MTHQSFKDQCDVNKIIAKFERTGELPRRGREPVYMTVPDESDFQTIQFNAAIARTMWEEMPEEERPATLEEMLYPEVDEEALDESAQDASQASEDRPIASLDVNRPTDSENPSEAG